MEEIQITLEMIDDFFAALKAKGKSQQTLRVYRGILERWYESLPEDKFIAGDVLGSWETLLREKGVAQSTFNNGMSIVKHFLKYLENPEAVHEKIPYEQRKKGKLEHALTRNEYQLMLHAAKERGYRRTYLFIKTIGGLGIRSTEVQYLTVGSVKKGEVTLTARGVNRTVKIYEPIRSDLLQYATESGIHEGPLFITKEGRAMQHFFIWKEIKKICRQIGMPEEKGMSSTLYNMYQETKRTFSAKSVEEVDLKYQKLLQEEEDVVGWDNSEVQQKASIEESEGLSTANIVVRTEGKRLRKEEKNHLAYQIGKALPKDVTSQYDCEVTIVFKKKEEVQKQLI